MNFVGKALLSSASYLPSNVSVLTGVCIVI